jgi:hypothetical protein
VSCPCSFDPFGERSTVSWGAHDCDVVTPVYCRARLLFNTNGDPGINRLRSDQEGRDDDSPDRESAGASSTPS